MTRETQGARRSWRDAAAVYLERRQLAILLLGFASGLPLLLTLSTLSYWLAKTGVDKTSIGLFALVGLPYSLKFIWAPLLDHVPAPLLSRVFGHRRGWILLLQGALALAILYMGRTDPQADAWGTGAAAVLIAFLSASQDIVIDAYRIEILSDEEQGAGAAVTQIGYRIGLLVAGAGAVAMSDVVGWPTIFAVLAACLGVGMAGALLAPEPKLRRLRADRPAAERLRIAVIDPFHDLMTRPGWLAALAFALLYKFGDAIGGVMANPLYVDLGFTGIEIASIAKVLGVLATIVGGVLGGVAVARIGLFAALLLGGFAQAITNLLFAVLAHMGHDLAMLAVAIGADSLTGGFGAAAFVAYLSALCNRRFTGTQYALLTSLMALGRTTLSSGGGWLADQMDWAAFFTLTTALAIPGLALLLMLRRWNLGLPPAAAPLETPPRALRRSGSRAAF